MYVATTPKRNSPPAILLSFQTLLKLMSQIVRNECRLPSTGPDKPTFQIVTTPNEKQKSAYDLLENVGRTAHVIFWLSH